MTGDVTSRQIVPKSPACPEGLFLMDGIEGLRSLPKHSVDMLLTDPPYGTTRNFWDVPLPLPELWEAVKWAVKPDGAVLFFAQCPYDKVLGALMAREVFRTVWKENAEDILGLLRMLDANLNTTGTPNDGNQLENKLSALNEELDDLVSQRASRSITMDDFLSRSTEINNEIINVEGLLQSSIQEQRPKARLDMHSIEAALSDDASFPDGKIEPGFLDRYTNRIVKINNRYIWMLQLMNVQQIMPIQSERQPIAMVTYKSGVPYDIEQEQIGKQDKESAGPDCATICRPQDFFLNMGRTKRKRKLVEWLESCQKNQVSVLDEKIPLLSFAVDFVTAYEYQKARGIKIHPGLWKDMRVDIFLVKKEN